MAKDLNKVTLTGRLGKDADVKVTPNGVAVTTFSVASSRNVRDGENWKEETEWFRVVAWRDLAERYGNALKKGTHVLIEGRLQTREWQDQQGQKRFSTEVIANDIYMLSPKQQDGGNSGVESFDRAGTPAQANRGRANSSYGGDDEMDAEDIPF